MAKESLKLSHAVSKSGIEGLTLIYDGTPTLPEAPQQKQKRDT